MYNNRLLISFKALVLFATLVLFVAQPAYAKKALLKQNINLKNNNVGIVVSISSQITRFEITSASEKYSFFVQENMNTKRTYNIPTKEYDNLILSINKLTKSQTHEPRFCMNRNLKLSVSDQKSYFYCLNQNTPAGRMAIKLKDQLVMTDYYFKKP